MPLSPPKTSVSLQGTTDLTVLARLKPGLVERIFDTETYRERTQRVLRTLNAIRQSSREALQQRSPLTDLVARHRIVHFFRFAVVPDPQFAQRPVAARCPVQHHGAQGNEAHLPPWTDREPDDHVLLNVTFDGGWEPYMRVIWGPLGTMLDLIFCGCKDYPLSVTHSYDEYIGWVRGHEITSAFFYTDGEQTVVDAAYGRQLDLQMRDAGGAADVDRQVSGLALTGEAQRVPHSLLAVESSLRALQALYDLKDLFSDRTVQQDTAPGPTHPPAAGPHPDIHATEQGILLRVAQELLTELRGWVREGLFDPGSTYGSLRARPGVDAQIQWLMKPRWRMGLAELQNPDTAARKDQVRPPAQLLGQRSPALGLTPDLLRPSSDKTARVQAGVIDSYPSDISHGVLGFFEVVDLNRAQAWLASAKVSAQGLAPGDGIYRHLAVTFAGLKALGVRAWRCERLPQEFIDGMERRAGLLGDVRGNHPQQWQRPRLDNGSQLEMGTVHLLLQLRCSTSALGQLPGLLASLADGTPARLNDELTRWTLDSGLRLLARQPMQRNTDEQGQPSGREHFGFADGLSQPRLQSHPPAARYWSDEVPPGVLLMGHANGRDTWEPPLPDVLGKEPDGSLRRADRLLDNASFMVVRKLRQFPDRLEAAVDRTLRAAHPDNPALQAALAPKLKAAMMGRGQEGQPLVAAVAHAGGNDFDYRHDAQGERCPHASHVRRANPRLAGGDFPTPRMMRRGMSYQEPTPGSASPSKGLVFMAFAASLSEQFEVVQRWLAGGNASGVHSAHDDPFIGVHDPGRERIFRCVIDGRVYRVDLSDAPLVTLQWGLYALVPSLDALRNWQAWAQADPSAPDGPVLDAPAAGARGDANALNADALDAEGQRWQARLEDRNLRPQAWAAARQQSPEGPLATAYGQLAQRPQDVMRILRDPGERWSTRGYRQRLKQTVGDGFLGQDDTGTNAGHLELAPNVNQAIEAWRDLPAYVGETRAVARGLLARLIGPGNETVDARDLSALVVAQLCRHWFGLPDAQGRYMLDPQQAARLRETADAQDPRARCPADFMPVSRYVFSSPYPSAAVAARAKASGQRVRNQVQAWLTAGEPQGDLTQQILKAALRAKPGLTLSEQAELLGGIMLGFPPTVIGSLASVWVAWVSSRELWSVQRRLLAPGDVIARLTDTQVVERLQRPLLGTLAKAPVPAVIWRAGAWPEPGNAAASGEGDPADACPMPPRERAVLNLAAALEQGADTSLLFGRAPADQAPTLHGCPGHQMALGVMLGLLAEVLGAGTLMETGSPLRLRVLRAAAP